MSSSSGTSSCLELASRLNRNYGNIEPFNNETTRSLSEYVSTHGVLLSMNMAFSFALPYTATHIAASWINGLTGVAIIPTPTQIGVVLKPAGIRCLYPTDAMTDVRDDKGCGPVTRDPEFGSQGAAKSSVEEKEKTRNLIEGYVNFTVGSDTDWQQVPCSELLMISSGPFDMVAWNSSVESPMSLSDFVTDMNEAFVDTPLCARDFRQPSVPLQPSDFYIYTGPQAWPTQDWQDAMDLQVKIKKDNPTVVYNWNEIVVELPKEFPDIVEAVFYIPGASRWLPGEAIKVGHAKREAKLLGKPLLRLDTNNAGVSAPFSCVGQETEVPRELVEREDEAAATASVLALHEAHQTIQEAGSLLRSLH